MLSRDVTTVYNSLRNLHLAEDLPWFSTLGYKVVDTPKPLQDWLLNFWHTKADEIRYVSEWEMSSTQTNFHEVQMKQVSMDRANRKEKVSFRKCFNFFFVCIYHFGTGCHC